MSDERQQGGLLNTIETVSKAALAIGAGAALFYRGGGSELLSSGFRKASRALNETMNTVSKTALKDMNSGFVSGISKNIKTILSEAPDNVVYLRTRSSNSIFSVVEQVSQYQENKRGFLTRMYNKELYYPIITDLQSKFGKKDNLLNRNIERFVDEVVSNSGEALVKEDGVHKFNTEFLKKKFTESNFSEELQQEMQDRIINVLNNESKENLELFIKNHEDVVDEFYDKAFDLEEMTKKFGRRDQRTQLGKAKDALLGDRPTTINEILDQAESLKFKNEQIKVSTGEKIGEKNAIEMLRRLREKDAGYGELIVDENILRTSSNGRIRSFSELSKAKDSFLDKAAETLPGKILKLKESIDIKRAPNLYYTGKGTSAPLLTHIAEKTDSVITSESYMRIYNKTFRINDNGSLAHIKGLDDYYLTSGRHGSVQRTIKSIMGDFDRMPMSNNKVSRLLDKNKGIGSNIFKKAGSLVSKLSDEKWGRNVVNSFLDMDPYETSMMINEYRSPSSEKTKEEARNYIVNLFNKSKKLNELFSKTTKPLDRSTINKLHDATEGRTKELLKMLTLNDQEFIEAIMKEQPDLIKNYNLRSLMSGYAKDTQKTINRISIESDKKGALGVTRGVRFSETIRKEVAKEAFFNYKKSNNWDEGSLLRLFDNAKITGQELKEAKYLANWETLQRLSNVYTRDRTIKDVEDMSDSILSMQHLFSSNGSANSNSSLGMFLESFKENVEQMSKENFSVLQKGFQKESDMIYGHNLGEYTYMKKAIGVKDILKNINDTTMWRSFGKQFIAGKKDPENITTATLIPYFSLQRLVDPMSAFGLGFSPKSTGNVVDLASSIFFKRILPIAGGATALSYLNYEARNITGTSLTGMFANSMANADLAGRKVIDKIGLGGALKKHYAINPMSQYWNEQEYQTYEERKEWYEDGYAPVRKGRWWSFGSASEFRGGKIDYYEPNYLKKAHSNWKDVGIYGSSKDKWKHSWLPTPRHPLSPLRALLDPYWLENKHYWDRPYPMTGKMFEEGTPWGAILNPTVGQMIKPQRKMHQDELQGSLVDVRTLIASRNAEVRNKANNNSSLVRLEDKGFTPVSYTPLGQPSPSESVASLSAGEGGASNSYIEGQDYSAMHITDYLPYHDEIQARAVAAGSGLNYSSSGTTKDGNLSFDNKVELAAAQGSAVAGMIRQSIPKGIITQLNKSTRQRATAMIAPKGGQHGIISNDAIFKESSGFSLQPNIDEGDLRNVTSTKEFLQDAGYSAKELLGMYGFLYETIAPSKKSYRHQSADRMTSSSRSFWDNSIGGAGGGFMEIARRFLPHEDHSVERINNIQNTMPEWMPGRFRFGDPYEKVPKGEMRLPGKGYEEMYELHSDQYGRYGAFDRMKILADIAPWSGEYKTWREIASKTIEDPKLKAEMDKIKDRVQEQSKQHQFYPYKFLGSDLESKKALITNVTPSGFQVYGEDTYYRMAGLKMEKGNKLEDYLQPGMTVNLKFGEDEAHQKGISAIVYSEGQNLNKQLLDSGAASESKDTSAAGLRARFTESEVTKGKLYELIAHAPIPFLHDKFMRVNSPMESWKNEQIYGTSYSTWNHPIQGFLTPALQKSFAVSTPHMALGTAAWLTSEYMHHGKGAGNVGKGLFTMAMLATNPGAFTGATTGFLLRLNKQYVEQGARIGAIVGLAGFTYTKSNNPIFASLGGAATGYKLAEHLTKGTGKTGAAIGLAAGLALSAAKNPDWDPDNAWGPWIPKRVKKRWEIEEYYDRLKYIKYMGLYEKAARLAKRKEDTDIKKIVNKFEYDSKEREKIKRQLLANRDLVSNTYAEGDSRAQEALNEIDSKLASLSYPQQILEAGEYTKSALAYKQAAESTVYGLKKDASWSQILRAVPKYERDYVLEFGKETDPKKRKEILKYMSPYRRRVLQSLWGEEMDDPESNSKFFSNHKLPGLFWSGWQPDVDLDNVEIKTIKNEGMLLSDFGFYDSQAQNPEAQMAPEVNYSEGTSAIQLKKNLIGSLSGAGLIGVNVSIEPSSQPGIQMIANVVRIGDYKIKQSINNVAGRLFY